jgi:hypothetical protein
MTDPLRRTLVDAFVRWQHWVDDERLAEVRLDREQISNPILRQFPIPIRLPPVDLRYWPANQFIVLSKYQLFLLLRQFTR